MHKKHLWGISLAPVMSCRWHTRRPAFAAHSGAYHSQPASRCPPGEAVSCGDLIGCKGEGMPRSHLKVLTLAEKRRLAGMGGFVALLHALGWGTLLLFVAPHHWDMGGDEYFGIGMGLTAYTLGMRHAFDADHIAAIDNTTRKLIADGRRPLSTGFWFSLGHSSIVFGLCALLALGIQSLAGTVENPDSTLQQTTSLIGTVVSGTFLLLIGMLNLAVFRPVQSLPSTARRHLRRSHPRGTPRPPRHDQPPPPPRDETRPQALAHVRRRPPVRPRLRHRHRGLPPRPRLRRRRLPTPLVRDARPARPLRRRHEPPRQHRRHLHELRLRLGLLPPGPQDLLQPHRHRALHCRRPCRRRHRDRLPRVLKRAMFLSAFAALHDPASRTYYDKCRARGKTHTQALLRLARQRINVLFAMLRDGTFYEPRTPRFA